MIYASYTMVLRRFTGPSTSVVLLFGSMGVAMLVFGTPVTLFFDLHGLERMTWKIFALLIFNGIFDNVISQYAWAKGVQWTSPTAATVGLSLTIPLSIVADLLRDKQLSQWPYVAASLVVLGFCAVTLAPEPAQPAATSL